MGASFIGNSDCQVNVSYKNSNGEALSTEKQMSLSDVMNLSGLLAVTAGNPGGISIADKDYTYSRLEFSLGSGGVVLPKVFIILIETDQFVKEQKEKEEKAHQEMLAKVGFLKDLKTSAVMGDDKAWN